MTCLYCLDYNTGGGREERQEFFCGGMQGQGQDALECNLMAPVKGKLTPLYILMMTMMMIARRGERLRV